MSSLVSPQGNSLKAWGAFLAALATVTLYLPMMMMQQKWQYDYSSHFTEASRLAQGGQLNSPHMLFHAVTAGLSRFMSLHIVTAGLTILTVCAALTAVLLYLGWTSKLPLPFGLKVAMVPLLLTVAPLTLLYGIDGHLYFGYVGINVFHNPTMLVMKPFALTTFWLAACFWRRSEEQPRHLWLWWVMPVLLALSALAKPSFLIVFLPGLTLFLLLRRLAGKFVDWRLYFFGVVVPSLLILGWQYWVTYSPEQLTGFYTGKSGIVLEPFKFMKAWSGWLLPKFFLSIAFPLTVAVAMWRSVRRDPQLLLAWSIFAAGAVQTYFLVESGPRAPQGNFVWGGQISLLILFVASAAHLFSLHKYWRESLRSPSWLLCVAVFLLHIIGGIAFYAAEYSAPQRYW